MKYLFVGRDHRCLGASCLRADELFISVLDPSPCELRGSLLRERWTD